MKLHRLLTNSALAVILGAFALAASSPAHAGTIIWTDWTSGTFVGNGVPSAGTATGNMGGITVTYNGQIKSIANGLFSPASTYQGGVVANAPTGNGVAMTGPLDGETITFSSPVTNPVIAIWSLGEDGDAAEFSFTDSFILEAGGPDGIVGGQSIEACNAALTVCSAIPGSSGTVAYGVEGSGSIMILGTNITSISFDTPNDEWFYGFTVGEQTPEPETLSLLGLGLLALPLLRASLARRRRA